MLDRALARYGVRRSDFRCERERAGHGVTEW